MTAHSAQAVAPPEHPAGEKRRRTLLTAALIGALAAGGYAFYWSPATQREEITEDAYVEGNIVQVTSQVTGTVVAIGADNADRVTAGQSLVKLNPLDAQLALERSEAMLGKTVRQVLGQYALASQMRANVALRRAELSKVQADMDRRAGLARSGAVSGEDVGHASEAVHVASAALQSAEQQYAASQAYVDGTTVATHPDVLSAASQVKEAYIAAARAVVPAPVAGIVARRNVQVGQRVAAGSSMMSIIPLESLWVTANFKESQLRHIHAGQPVMLTADAYGRQVTYRGKVIGQEAGTGSAFSLMPAQNATGNWIKVVQRLPVRIALDANQVRANPLQLGLSMRVSVDTSKRDGVRFATPNDPAHGYETGVFAQEGKDAAALVTHIIATNMAGSSASGPN